MQLENNFTIEAPIEKAWEALNTPETIAPCFPGATLTEYEGDSFAGTVKIKLGPISLTYKGKGVYKERDDAAHRVVIDASGRDSRGNGTATATVTGTMTADGPDRTAVSMVTDMTITGRPAQFGRGVISDVADKIIGQFAGCVAKKLAPAAEAPAASAEATAPPAPPAPPAPVATVASPEPVTSAAAPSAPSAPVAAGRSNGTARGAATTTATTVTATTSTATTSTATGPTLSSTPSSAGVPAPEPAARPTGPVRSEVDAIDLLDSAGAPVLKRLAPAAGGALLLALLVLLVRRLRSG